MLVTARVRRRVCGGQQVNPGVGRVLRETLARTGWLVEGGPQVCGFAVVWLTDGIKVGTRGPFRPSCRFLASRASLRLTVSTEKASGSN